MKNRELKIGMLFLICIGVVILVLGIKSARTNSSQQSSARTIPLSFVKEQGNINIEVELAVNAQQREQGLMYRDSMPANHGMLFVFQKEQNVSFWMANTYIPLDIIFLDSEKKVINATQNATPLRTDITYESFRPALYVLEVNGGFCAQNNITFGDQLNFQLPQDLVVE